jgi:hypothetical protein
LFQAFIFALTCSPCLLSSGLSGLVYEILRDCFVLDDFVNGFEFFFEICGYIVHNYIPPSISCMLVASQLLALKKQTKGV